ncbi:MAG: hypothetical protein JNK26_03200 [Candidatus Doudnabacteria bacterium]|nr:hypothetical protein [Candidatus Doudnabacteria bacterium]
MSSGPEGFNKPNLGEFLSQLDLQQELSESLQSEVEGVLNALEDEKALRFFGLFLRMYDAGYASNVLDLAPLLLPKKIRVTYLDAEGQTRTNNLVSLVTDMSIIFGLRIYNDALEVIDREEYQDPLILEVDKKIEKLRNGNPDYLREVPNLDSLLLRKTYDLLIMDQTEFHTSLMKLSVYLNTNKDSITNFYRQIPRRFNAFYTVVDKVIEQIKMNPTGNLERYQLILVTLLPVLKDLPFPVLSDLYSLVIDLIKNPGLYLHNSD